MMSPEDIVTEVDRLSSIHPTDRELADRYLRGLTPEEVDRLLEWSQAAESNQSVVNTCSGCGFACFGLAGLGASIVAVITVISSKFEAVFPLTMGLVGLAVAGWAIRQVRSREVSVENEVLKRLDNPEVCGPILERLFAVSPAVRGSAADALRRLMPRIKASNSRYFTPGARKTLTSLATSAGGLSYDTDFVVMAVEGLAQVGDEASEKALERMLRQKPYGKRETRIHQVAAITLEALRNRLHEQRQSHTLLRASNEHPSGSLLRPSGSAPISDPDLLLRPGEDRAS